MAQYEVHYELDETGWWLTTIPEIQGCHTQGSTLVEAKDRIRECLGLFISSSDAESADLLDAIQLPASVSEAVKTISEFGVRAADLSILLESVGP